ncbi:hypothetical protein NHQ30_009454 [Ciborinia camelliae]|nr:hypothetical protein NHQ30_009454 [Ciborinia camelliae]
MASNVRNPSGSKSDDQTGDLSRSNVDQTGGPHRPNAGIGINATPVEDDGKLFNLEALSKLRHCFSVRFLHATGTKKILGEDSLENASVFLSIVVGDEFLLTFQNVHGSSFTTGFLWPSDPASSENKVWWDSLKDMANANEWTMTFKSLPQPYEGSVASLLLFDRRSYMFAVEGKVQGTTSMDMFLISKSNVPKKVITSTDTSTQPQSNHGSIVMLLRHTVAYPTLVSHPSSSLSFVREA